MENKSYSDSQLTSGDIDYVVEQDISDVIIILTITPWEAINMYRMCWFIFIYIKTEELKGICYGNFLNNVITIKS